MAFCQTDAAEIEARRERQVHFPVAHLTENNLRTAAADIKNGALCARRGAKAAKGAAKGKAGFLLTAQDPRVDTEFRAYACANFVPTIRISHRAGSNYGDPIDTRGMNRTRVLLQAGTRPRDRVWAESTGAVATFTHTARPS